MRKQFWRKGSQALSPDEKIALGLKARERWTLWGRLRWLNFRVRTLRGRVTELENRVKELERGEL